MSLFAGAGTAAVGALLGGIAGGAGNRSTQRTDSSLRLRNVDQLNIGEGAVAGQGRDVQMAQFEGLQELLQMGGMDQARADIGAARASQLQLAQMLEQAQGGPSAQNIAQAQAFTRDIFAPEEEAMRQQFSSAETETARLAARLGRSVDDPILRAKLASSQADQMAQMGAQRRAFTAQTAQGFQQQQLQLQNQLAQVRGGLATQALQNRQALMGMGQALLQQERDFRMGAAGRASTTTQTSGGGVGGVIGGALAGAGAGLQAIGTFGSFNNFSENNQPRTPTNTINKNINSGFTGANSNPELFSAYFGSK